ncbi:hypothetical protein WA158_005350 [Blastocystis sp. Blastoise]
MKVDIIFFGTPYTCSVEPSSSLLSLQEEICDNTSVAIPKQHIIFKGQVINDCETSTPIGVFGIQDNSQIFLFNKGNCSIVYVELIYQLEQLSIYLPENITLKTVRSVFVNYLNDKKQVDESRLECKMDLNSMLKEVILANKSTTIEFYSLASQKRINYRPEISFSPATRIDGRISEISPHIEDETRVSINSFLPLLQYELDTLTTYKYDRHVLPFDMFIKEFSQDHFNQYDSFIFNNIVLTEAEGSEFVYILKRKLFSSTKHFLFWDVTIPKSITQSLYKASVYYVDSNTLGDDGNPKERKRDIPIYLYGTCFWDYYFQSDVYSRIFPYFNQKDTTNLDLKNIPFDENQLVHICNALYRMNTEIITDINLSNTQLGDKGLKCLCSIMEQKKLPQLHTLVLSNNLISNQGTMYLSPLFKQHKCDTLQILDLSNNIIGSQGIWMVLYCIVEGDINKTITTLKFSHNDIGNTGINQISHIFQISEFPELMEIDISYNRISSEGIKAFFNSLYDSKVQNLRVINCTHNLINDDFGKYFISFLTKKCCPYFLMIYIAENKLTPEGYQKLSQYSMYIHDYPVPQQVKQNITPVVPIKIQRKQSCCSIL